MAGITIVHPFAQGIPRYASVVLNLKGFDVSRVEAIATHASARDVQ